MSYVVNTSASLRAAVAIRNFLFHSGRVNKSALQPDKSSDSITHLVIEALKKAIVEDLYTYISPGLTGLTILTGA
jgi:hypothetical protein